MKYLKKKNCLFVLCCLSIPQLWSRLVIEMERGLGADTFITLLEASAPLSRKKTNLKVENGASDVCVTKTNQISRNRDQTSVEQG